MNWFIIKARRNTFVSRARWMLKEVIREWPYKPLPIPSKRMPQCQDLCLTCSKYNRTLHWLSWTGNPFLCRRTQNRPLVAKLQGVLPCCWFLSNDFLVQYNSEMHSIINLKKYRMHLCSYLNRTRTIYLHQDKLIKYRMHLCTHLQRTHSTIYLHQEKGSLTEWQKRTSSKWLSWILMCT